MDKSVIVILVCCLYFVLMVLAGLYAMSRNKKASDFLVAGRKINLPMTVATLTAIQIGAGIVLGGMWGVVITDAIQTIIIAIGIPIIAVASLLLLIAKPAL